MSVDLEQLITHGDLIAFQMKLSADIAASSEEHLRDRIAIAALQGLLAHRGCISDERVRISTQVYDIADAMLEARKR